jgi:hypothetical protein
LPLARFSTTFSTDYGDVYVRDLQSERTRLVSKTSGGAEADNHSDEPSISTGQYVAFESYATNLPGNDTYSDVYVHGPLTDRSGSRNVLGMVYGERLRS